MIVLAAGMILLMSCGLVGLVAQEQTRDLLTTTIEAAKWTAVAVAVAVSLLALAGAVAISARLLARARQIYPDRETGLFPMLPADDAHFDPNPVEVRLLAAAASSGRLSAPATRAILAPAKSAPTVIDGRAEEIAEAICSAEPWRGQIDLRHRPHFGFFGATRSGKSTAIYALTERIAQADPGAEFLMLEPGGATWGDQVAAYTDQAIADALVEAERELWRRQEILRSANVNDACDLIGSAPARLVVVVEEAEAAFDNLRRGGGAAASRAQVAIRNLARMGGKVKISLITATQYGRGDSFDTAMKANLDIYCFRAPAGAAEMLRVSRQVDLTRLPTGTAYSISRGRLIQFPQVSRPPLLPCHLLAGAVPGNGNGGNGPVWGHGQEQEREQEQGRRWDQFLADAIADGHPRSPTHLARLMARHDGRPGEFEAYKSIAWRFLHPGAVGSA